MALSEELKIEAFRKIQCMELPIRFRERRGAVKLNTLKDGIINELFLFRKRFSP
jgi:hypothetical protein